MCGCLSKLPLEKNKPPDTPDDEFSSTPLNSKWTLVDGGAGTVNLFATSTTGIYDLETRPGWILFQINNGNHVQLRQDYTLPDGKSLVASIGMPVTLDGGSGIGLTSSEYQFWVGLNTDDTSPLNGDGTIMFFHVGSNLVTVFHNRYVAGVQTNVGTLNTVGTINPHGKAYFRIHRSGTTYYAFLSTDGFFWHPMGFFTHSAALSNIWIFARGSANPGTPLAIMGIDWIREGGASLDPW